MNPFRPLVQYSRRLLMRAKGARIAHSCTIGSQVHVCIGVSRRTTGSIEIRQNTRLDNGVMLEAHGGRIELGTNVFIGPYTVIYGHGGVSIGDDCLIAMHCRLLSSEHAVPTLENSIRCLPDVKKPTRLGRDVWLGAGVTVLGGVTISDGCVVGAGAVVTKDLPVGAIAYGVPCRIVGQRPHKNTIA